MNLDCYFVNAFIEGPFSGNPAAVVPLEAWLADSVLQQIASQHNLPETAFFVERKDPGHYDLRWFTPSCEVPLCGHATLATASVILDDLAVGLTEVKFHTQSGVLTVTRTEDGFALDFPSLPASGAQPPEGLIAALGGSPSGSVLRGPSWLVVYPNEAAVAVLAPDMAALAKLELNVMVTAPGTQVDFVSRFFAPGIGIPEDPVTGSAHSTLAPYWASRLNKTRLSARQLSPRGGRLDVTVSGDRVSIEGKVYRYADARIFPQVPR